LEDDSQKFKHSFRNIVGHSLNLYFKSLVNLFPKSSTVDSELKRQTLNFACLSNFVALKGGAIKKEQFLSGDMADIFSNLYLAYAVKWYHQQNSCSDILTKYCLERLLDENRIKFNQVINNLGGIRYPILHLKQKIKTDNYQTKRDVLEEINQNPKIMDLIKEDVYTHGTILEELETLNSLDKNSQEYKDLYNKIIQVGEYPIEKPRFI